MFHHGENAVVGIGRLTEDIDLEHSYSFAIDLAIVVMSQSEAFLLIPSAVAGTHEHTGLIALIFRHLIAGVVIDGDIAGGYSRRQNTMDVDHHFEGRSIAIEE